MDEAYNDVGFSTIHNIDISGKTDRISYYFSGGYNRQNGMLRYGNDIYNRYNLRTKLQFKLTDWWSLSSNVSLTTSDYDYANAMTNTYKQMYRKNPMDMVKNPDNLDRCQCGYIGGIGRRRTCYRLENKYKYQPVY